MFKLVVLVAASCIIFRYLELRSTVELGSVLPCYVISVVECATGSKNHTLSALLKHNSLLSSAGVDSGMSPHLSQVQ